MLGHTSFLPSDFSRDSGGIPLLLKRFSKYKVATLGGDGGGTGIFTGDSGQLGGGGEEGLGLGGPGLYGLPHEFTMPQGFQGYQGAGSGPWSVGTPVESDKMLQHEVHPELQNRDFTAPQLQKKIKNRMEVGDEPGDLFKKKLLQRRERGERLAHFEDTWRRVESNNARQAR